MRGWIQEEGGRGTGGMGDGMDVKMKARERGALAF